MKTFLILAYSMICLNMAAAPATYTLNYATPVNRNCIPGDTLKFYGNASDHYIVTINSVTVINSTAIITSPFYIGYHIVSATDTAYSISRMSLGPRTGTLNVSSVTGLNEQAPHSHKIMVAFPNPAHDVIFLESVSSQEAEIYSQDSKLVTTFPVSKGINTIDLSTLSSGIYFIRLDGLITKVIRE